MKTICVIAGNKKEFDEFIHSLAKDANRATVFSSGRAVIDGVRYVYAYTVNSILWRQAELKFIGSWEARTDAVDLRGSIVVLP